MVYQRKLIFIFALLAAPLALKACSAPVPVRVPVPAVSKSVSYACTAPASLGAGPVELLCDALKTRLNVELEDGVNLVRAPLGGMDGPHLIASLERLGSDIITGRLSWTVCSDGICQPKVTGELMEASVMDSVVSASTYSLLVRGMLLVARSPSPGWTAKPAPLPWRIF